MTHFSFHCHWSGKPEVDDTMLLAGSVTMGRMAGQHGHLQAEGKRVPHPHIS